MKKILGFSLVELMISLIVISIVTAAFAPVLTKKLKTSDQSIGTATATSITSSAVCNSVSKGCIECENDKCLAPADGYFINETTGKSQSCNSVISGCAQCDSAAKCTKSEDGYYFDGSKPVQCPSSCTKCSSSSTCSACNSGYYLNSSQCTSCSVQNAACQTCSSSSTCTKCAERYVLSNGKCAACPNHCKNCSSSSVCTTCDDSYFLTSSNACWKYECPNNYCYLTYHNDSQMTLYRYMLGEGDLSDLGRLNINVCYAHSNTCSYGSPSPVCTVSYAWQSVPTAEFSTCSVLPIGSYYSRCYRARCNFAALLNAQNVLKVDGWRIPNSSDVLSLSEVVKAAIKYRFNVDPLPVSLDSSNRVIGMETTFTCMGQAESNRCMPWVRMYNGSVYGYMSLGDYGAGYGNDWAWVSLSHWLAPYHASMIMFVK